MSPHGYTQAAPPFPPPPVHGTGLLAELSHLESLYHAACPGASTEAFARVVAPDFWEIGASGRRYERAFCLQVQAQRASAPAHADWRTRDEQLRALGTDHALLTYTLEQPGRVTLRATVWRRGAQGWQAVFHQGTVVQP